MPRALATPEWIEVELELDEYEYAVYIGFKRQLLHLARRTRQRHGAVLNPYQDEEAACAECAVAAYYDLPWHDRAAGAEPYDCGFLQVRHTRWDTGQLLVYPDEKDDDPFILVTGAEGIYYLRGWLPGAEAKDPRWWGTLCREGHPCFHVPQAELRPMATLPVRRTPEGHFQIRAGWKQEERR